MSILTSREQRVLSQARYCVGGPAATECRTSCAFYLFIRVMEITDILSQNVPLEDVQYLAGHSNPSGHTDL